MPNFIVGLILGVGVGGWVYSKIIRSSGGNNTSALTVAAFAGVAALVVMMMILGAIS